MNPTEIDEFIKTQNQLLTSAKLEQEKVQALQNLEFGIQKISENDWQAWMHRHSIIMQYYELEGTLYIWSKRSPTGIKIYVSPESLNLNARKSCILLFLREQKES